MNNITLGQDSVNNGLSVLIDNFTILQASKLLCNSELKRMHLPIDSPPDASSVAEICALSTLIDSLILFDNVYVYERYANEWINELPELRDFVQLVEIPNNLYSDIKKQNSAMASALVAHESFRKYIRYLQAQDVEGLVLRSVYNYHGVYADWIKESVAELGIADLYSNELRENSSILQLMGRYGSKSAIPDTCMMLSHGAIFYEAIASVLNIPYLPHAFRAPFCIYDSWASKAVKGVTYSPIQLLESKRNKNANELNQFFGEQICDIVLPGLLAMILSQSSSPNDILKNTLNVASSERVKKYRKFIHSVVDDLKEGKLMEAHKKIDKIRNYIEMFDNAPPYKVNFTLSISPSISFPIPNSTKDFLSKNRFLFIKDVWTSLAEVTTIQRDINRIWGKDFLPRDYDLNKLWDWLQIDLETTSLYG